MIPFHKFIETDDKIAEICSSAIAGIINNKIVIGEDNLWVETSEINTPGTEVYMLIGFISVSDANNPGLDNPLSLIITDCEKWCPVYMKHFQSTRSYKFIPMPIGPDYKVWEFGNLSLGDAKKITKYINECYLDI